MDANGQQFWMVSKKNQLTHFLHTQWDDKNRVIKLKSERDEVDCPKDKNLAKTFFNEPAATIDATGAWAYVNQSRNRIWVNGFFDEPYTIYENENSTIYDVSINAKGLLFAVIQEQDRDREVHIIDPHNKNETIKLSLNEQTTIDCIVTLVQGGAWVLDREAGQLYKIVGEVIPDRPQTLYTANTERPCTEFPNEIKILRDDARSVPDNYSAVSISANEKNQVAILLWHNDAAENASVMFITKSALSPLIELSKAVAPLSIGFLKNNLWAVKFANLNQAIAYELPETPKNNEVPAVASGDRYPLNVDLTRNINNRPFFNSFISPVFYQTQIENSDDGDGDENLIIKPKPVFSLSKPGLAKYGLVELKKPFDSLQPATEWHRIYIEASIPKETGVRVLVCARDEKAEDDECVFYPHDFNFVKKTNLLEIKNIPQGSHCKQLSELAHNKSLLHCSSKPDEAGLFTVLIQSTGKKVNDIKGRYLYIKIELYGNGQVTPEVAALRFYAPRFSYVDKYLPELYRETLFGEQANAPGDATGADFLKRYLSLFESVLTPLEDKIANAHLYTNPTTAPTEALEWLGKWIGLSLEPGLPEQQRRNMIKHAMEVYRFRGTLRGLSLAIDLASDSLISKGQLVVLEDFRLRRTFATIIGADLNKYNDPLMMDQVTSSNSYIGDTFILGDSSEQNLLSEEELLALYGADVNLNIEDEEQKNNFFSELANRITVLVHRDNPQSVFKLIRKIVSLEAPAHIETRVLGATQPLITGLYSLIGVDTYLGKKHKFKAAKLDDFHFGGHSLVTHQQASLDNRME